MLTWRENISVALFNVVASFSTIMALYWNPGTKPASGVVWDYGVFTISLFVLLHLYSSQLRALEASKRIEWSKMFKAEQMLVDEKKWVWSALLCVLSEERGFPTHVDLDLSSVSNSTSTSISTSK